ncbi:elongation of fatty acids protein 3-like [Selaginella moellendorffii]|nr:elongation of fatty acids protein 3-like [Selaginella moellendorffii]|eukprot:XP_002980011.2 elongation of fatty acids protein 3-like [Selaginella moellendorffii]
MAASATNAFNGTAWRSVRSSIRYWAAEHPPVARFRWDFNTFGASWTFLVASVPLYLSLVLLLKLLLSFRKRPVPLGPVPVLHNMVLVVGSAAMFIGCLQATVIEIQENRWLWNKKKGLNWLLCFPLGTRSVGRVFFWSYVYYLSKFYELLDTAILILRKKPLTFLHVFHHSTVIVMCFFWLQFTQSLQVIALLTNTGVHVAMYTYYLLCSLGLHPPWKKMVTNLQIYQFLFSFVVSLAMMVLHLGGEGCAGIGAWSFNFGFNIILLMLFANFHSQQYGNANGQGKKKRM